MISEKILIAASCQGPGV